MCEECRLLQKQRRSTAYRAQVRAGVQVAVLDMCRGLVVGILPWTWWYFVQWCIYRVPVCIVTLYHQAQLKEQCQGKADSLIHSILFSALVLMYIFLVYSVHSLRPLSHTNFSASLSLLPPPKSKFFFSPLFRFSSSLSLSLFLFSLWDFLSYYTLPHTFSSC